MQKALNVDTLHSVLFICICLIGQWSTLSNYQRAVTWRSWCAAIKTPAPHSSAGHSRRRRLIFPLSSTCKYLFIVNNRQVHSRSTRYPNLIILELSKMHCLVLVADLLGGGVVLLLPLLGPSSQPDTRMFSWLQSWLRTWAQDGESTLSECCSPTESCHPPAVCLMRKWINARDDCSELISNTGKDKPLLVRWDPLLILNLSLHILDRVGWLHLHKTEHGRIFWAFAACWDNYKTRKETSKVIVFPVRVFTKICMVLLPLTSETNQIYQRIICWIVGLGSWKPTPTLLL